MKYTVQVLIEKDIDTVVDVMRDKDATFKWMKTLKEFDLIEGEPETEGSKYKMVFENKGKMETMIETIEEFNPPRNINTLYEMGSVKNWCINEFKRMGESTLYVMHTEFKFPFLMGLVMPLFKGMFKKHSLKGIEDFRDYVESLK